MAKIALKHLSEDDVRLIVKHPDPEKRAQAAQRVCRTVRNTKLSEAERKFAQRLMKYMADDAVALVRRALAVTLRNSPDLPRDLALKLATDIDNIAVPVIANSPSLTDDDLIEILRSKAATKVLAVCKRPTVSGDVVRAVVRYGDSHAVAEVAANDGAEIDRKTAEYMLALYHDNDLLKNAFISRKDLPVFVMEKLITMVSEEAAIVLQNRHDIPAEVTADIADRTRERATIDLTERGLNEKDTARMMRRLHDEARLTVSMLIRIAGTGRMDMLKHAIAARTGLNPNRVSLMLHDGGPLGLKALCRQAGLSEPQAKIIRAACSIYRDLEVSGIIYDSRHFRSLMIERMLTLPLDLPAEDETWLLERFDGLSNDIAA